MRNWTWEYGEYASAYFSFNMWFVEEATTFNLREIVSRFREQSGLSGFALASPDIIPGLDTVVVDSYWDDQYYALRVERKARSYDEFYTFTAQRDKVFCTTTKTHYAKYEGPFMELLRFLLVEEHLQVEKWWIGEHDDYGENLTIQAKGDHQALLEYLEIET